MTEVKKPCDIEVTGEINQILGMCAVSFACNVCQRWGMSSWSTQNIQGQSYDQFLATRKADVKNIAIDTCTYGQNNQINSSPVVE